MYRCQHFKIQELVPPNVFNQRGNAAWELLDANALITLDALRSHFGRAICNDYSFGGKRQWSGLRTADSPYYSPYSQHSFGRAFDLIFLDAKTEEVREEIIRLRDKKFPLINGLELDVSWIHFDVRNHSPLKLFKP